MGQRGDSSFATDEGGVGFNKSVDKMASRCLEREQSRPLNRPIRMDAREDNDFSSPRVAN